MTRPKMGKERVCHYVGGPRVCSRNSSILMKSVFSSLLNSKKGGLVPGAKSFNSSGFLEQRKQAGSEPVTPLPPPAPKESGHGRGGGEEGAQDQKHPQLCWLWEADKCSPASESAQWCLQVTLTSSRTGSPWAMHFGRQPKSVLAHSCIPSEVGSPWAVIVPVQGHTGYRAGRGKKG